MSEEYAAVEEVVGDFYHLGGIVLCVRFALLGQVLGGWLTIGI